MGTKRISLQPEDKEDDDAPVVTGPEELKEEMDKSHMPEEDRSHPSQSGREETAVARLVEKLKERGKSDEFIQAHMEEIREKVRREVL